MPALQFLLLVLKILKIFLQSLQAQLIPCVLRQTPYSAFCLYVLLTFQNLIEISVQIPADTAYCESPFFSYDLQILRICK